MTPPPSGPIRRIGVLGAGKSGIAIARRALTVGYEVRIATSGPAWRTAMVTGTLAPGSVAVDAANLAAQVDAVVVAVPLRKFRELALETLADRIVIDVMNYWPPVDGVLAEFETDPRPSSAIVQSALPGTARVVKTFNHIGYHEIEELARPSGSPGRVAVAIAGDDPAAVEVVSRLVDDVGFDPIPAGRLEDSAALQPGSPVFGADLTAEAMRAALTRISTPAP